MNETNILVVLILRMRLSIIPPKKLYIWEFKMLYFLRAKKLWPNHTVTSKGKKDFGWSSPSLTIPNYYTKSKHPKKLISFTKLFAFTAQQQWFSFTSNTKANRYSKQSQKCIYTYLGVFKIKELFLLREFLQWDDQGQGVLKELRGGEGCKTGLLTMTRQKYYYYYKAA